MMILSNDGSVMVSTEGIRGFDFNHDNGEAVLKIYIKDSYMLSYYSLMAVELHKKILEAYGFGQEKTHNEIRDMRYKGNLHRSIDEESNDEHNSHE